MVPSKKVVTFKAGKIMEERVEAEPDSKSSSAHANTTSTTPVSPAAAPSSLGH